MKLKDLQVQLHLYKQTDLDSFLKRLVLSSISDIFSWMIKEQYLQNKILSLFHYTVALKGLHHAI